MSVTKPEVQQHTPWRSFAICFYFLLSFSKIAIHVPISN